MATRRLRPEDWAPVPQTRIQIRSPEPRDECINALKCAQKPPRPAAINYPPGESPPLPKSRESVEADSPRAPEVIDFAAPSTWPRRGLPSHIAYQQQQCGPRRVASPGSMSQYSSRQSEMSFGILDYYTCDPSPTRSPTLPPTPKLPQVAGGPPKIATPVLDPGLEKFDFGLPLKRQDRGCGKGIAFESAATTIDVTAGAEQTDVAKPPPTPPKMERFEAPKTTYSLFPKDTSLPSRPSTTMTDRQDSSPTQESAPSSSIASIPSHQQPDPSYRPRKESLTSSLRSRKDSFKSYRANRIPLRVFSASSNSASNSSSSAYTTPRTSNALPTNTRPSISPPSRWSEDTITSPTIAAFPSSGRRASFGSLLRGVEDERQSGQYPACFFEDDDDEVVPLRRKLHWGKGRSVSLQSQQQGKRAGRLEEYDGERRASSSIIRRVLLCGCGG